MSYTTFREEVNINKNHLDRRYSNHFTSNNVIDKISYEICQKSFLPKKEYAESIEVVRILLRFIRSWQNLNVYDICGGHGFVGILLDILSKGVNKSYIIDQKKPLSHERLVTCIQESLHIEKYSINFLQEDFKNIEYKPNSLLIGIHACSTLSDEIMNLAFEKNSAVAILPCCYKQNCLPGQLRKFTDTYELSDLVDIYRINKANNLGYKINLRKISSKITPMNKMFIFLPKDFYKLQASP